MSIYGELDPTLEHGAQFAFMGKRRNMAKVNILNFVYPNQRIDIEILHISKHYVIVPDTIKSYV